MTQEVLSNEFARVILESLVDDEPNDCIESIILSFKHDLNKLLNNNKLNTQFIFLFVKHSIKRATGWCESDFEKRIPLLAKFVCNGGGLKHSLISLVRIIEKCHNEGLTFGQIDRLVKLLEEGKVISTFVRNHWSEVSNPNSSENNDVAYRVHVIGLCIWFLNFMEDFRNENEYEVEYDNFIS